MWPAYDLTYIPFQNLFGSLATLFLHPTWRLMGKYSLLSTVVIVITQSYAVVIINMTSIQTFLHLGSYTRIHPAAYLDAATQPLSGFSMSFRIYKDS